MHKARVKNALVETGSATGGVGAAADGEDEGAHGAVFRNVRDWRRLMVVLRMMVRMRGGRREHCDEVGDGCSVASIGRDGGSKSRDWGVRRLEEIFFAGLVDGKNARPDVDENGFEFGGGSLEEPEDVGKDPNGKGHVHGRWSCLNEVMRKF